jgi:hypothetical protein
MFSEMSGVVRGCKEKDKIVNSSGENQEAINSSGIINKAGAVAHLNNYLRESIGGL